MSDAQKHKCDRRQIYALRVCGTEVAMGRHRYLTRTGLPTFALLIAARELAFACARAQHPARLIVRDLIAVRADVHRAILQHRAASHQVQKSGDRDVSEKHVG